MVTSLESSVVRIYSNSGKVVGAGFLVSQNYVLTCAHVVASALGIAPTTAEMPATGVTLDFPRIAVGVPLTANVVFWRPVHPNPSTLEEFEEDIAVLELGSFPPDASQPVRLVTSEDLWGHPFRVFGFPEGQSNGVWASGVLRGGVASGWVQLEDVKEAGYRLEKGFSGAPVWDEELQSVAGMAVAAEMNRPQVKAAFIIPAYVLTKILPRLASNIQVFVAATHDLEQAVEISSHNQQATICPILFLPDNLPDNYVERPKVLDALRQALLGNNDMVGVVGCAALHGLGGLGKTVLARAICDDPIILSAFPDGILWATLGQEADPVRNQREWIGSLGGDTSVAFSIASGKVELKRLLEDRAMLLILDDVWNVKDIQALRVGGSRCKILITTRDAMLAEDASLIPLEQMQQQESRTLLRWASHSKITNEDQLDTIAGRLGHLPLALKIVGAMLAKGIPWKDIVEALDEGDMNFVSYGSNSIMVAIDTSVQQLSSNKRERYLELVIFPTDQALVEAAVRRLWFKTAELKPRYTRQLMVEFSDRALIQVDNTLHDLQYDYLQSIVPPDKQQQLHSAMVDTYGDPDSWSALPLGEDQDYGWRYLAYHLAKAERLDDLYTLLTNCTYLQTKIERLGTDALLRDFALLPIDSPRQKVAEALKLGAHILDREPRQLHNQLYGRLGLLPDLHNIAIVTRPHLKLESQTLTPPSRPTLSKLNGHVGGVNSCSFNLNGEQALSASIDGTLRLWNLASGQTIRVLEGHTDQVRDCDFSLDGQLALSASIDGMLRLWDINSGQTIRVLEGHLESLRSCEFSPNGQLIVSSADDGTLRLWDVNSGQTICVLKGHRTPVYDCAFSPDGQLIVSAADDGTLRLWDVNSGRTIRMLEGHTDPVRSCAFSPDGQLIVSASGDRTLRLWDVSSGQTIRIFKGHEGSATGCIFSPDGKFVLSSAWDRTLRLWDVSSGQTIRIFKGHKGSVNSCAFSKDSKFVLSGAWDCTLRLWNVNNGQTIHVLDGHINYVRACAFSPDGQLALSGSDDGLLRLWNVKSRQNIHILKGHADYIRGCAFSPDGKYAPSASDDTTLRLWDVNNKQTIRIFEGHTGYVRACVFSSNGQFIISASWDSTLRVWDANSGQTIRIFEGHTNGVTDCALHTNERLCLSASEDCTLRLWDVNSGKVLRVLEGHTDFVRSCAFSPNGKYAISASVDGRFLLWDGNSWHSRPLEGHTDYIRGCTFSPDSKYVISASDDSTLRLWEVKTGKEIARWFADGSLMCCAISGDQQHIIVGDSLNKLHFLKLENI